MTMQGHNNPPTPMEEVVSAHDDLITEAQNWTDGEPVTDEASMKAVDELIKGMKSYRSALTKAVKEYTGPAHDIWKGKVAEGKVYTDDADLMQKSLVAIVAPFKAKLAEQKEAERRAAWEAAESARKAAEEAEKSANAGNVDDLRAAEAAKKEALGAQKAAQAARKDKVKGMRTTQHHEIVDMRALVNWIAKNDKDAMAEFATAYAAKHHGNIPDAVVRSWTTKEAF